MRRNPCLVVGFRSPVQCAGDKLSTDTIMTDPHDEPASPCVGICQINPLNQLCDGCFRSDDEVAAWWDMSSASKRALLAELEARRERVFDDLFE